MKGEMFINLLDGVVLNAKRSMSSSPRCDCGQLATHIHNKGRGKKYLCPTCWAAQIVNEAIRKAQREAKESK